MFVLKVSIIDPTVAMYNDEHGSVVLVNTNDVRECINRCDETGLSDEQVRNVVLSVDSVSFNCQDTESAVARVGHTMYAELFPV